MYTACYDHSVSMHHIFHCQPHFRKEENNGRCPGRLHKHQCVRALTYLIIRYILHPFRGDHMIPPWIMNVLASPWLRSSSCPLVLLPAVTMVLVFLLHPPLAWQRPTRDWRCPPQRNESDSKHLCCLFLVKVKNIAVRMCQLPMDHNSMTKINNDALKKERSTFTFTMEWSNSTAFQSWISFF